MTAKVADASAIVALLFDEHTRDEVLPRLRDVSLHAPSLLAFEVASACLRKIRAAPAEREALLQAFGLFDSLSIELQPIDLAQALVLAEQSALTIYDASYLWLRRRSTANSSPSTASLRAPTSDCAGRSPAGSA